MKVYENIVILDTALPDEQIDAAREKIKELIAGSGGEVLKVDNWGRRKLAYEINKQSRGYYILFLFKAETAFIKKLEDYYKVFDPVIKSMVVRLERKQEEAAIKSVTEENAARAGS